MIGMASPMLQEIFGGELIGLTLKFDELSKEQLGQIAAIAAAFTGLLSLFNIAGRFFWASLSDYIGRKATYFIFFTLGIHLVRLRAVGGTRGQAGPVRRVLLRDPDHVRRRVRDNPRVSRRTCSARRWWAPFTAVC